jgi:hypothetical protein
MGVLWTGIWVNMLEYLVYAIFEINIALKLNHHREKLKSEFFAEL